MIFGVMEAMGALRYAQAVYEYERESEARFRASLADWPLEQQAGAIEARRVAKEKLAKEREIERRHEELCRAIRDSRPRGMGVFW